MKSADAAVAEQPSNIGPWSRRSASSIGLRTREVLIEQLKTKTSIALTRPMIYHPEVQHGTAEITMDLETVESHVEAIATDWIRGTCHAVAPSH